MQIEVKRTTKIPSFNYVLDTRTLFSTVLTITNAEHLSEVNKARQSPLSPGDECELFRVNIKIPKSCHKNFFVGTQIVNISTFFYYVKHTLGIYLL
jgi:hypothetical protein